jgi:hypothetical protein
LFIDMVVGEWGWSGVGRRIVVGVATLRVVTVLGAQGLRLRRFVMMLSAVW